MRGLAGGESPPTCYTLPTIPNISPSQAGWAAYSWKRGVGEGFDYSHRESIQDARAGPGPFKTHVRAPYSCLESISPEEVMGEMGGP